MCVREKMRIGTDRKEKEKKCFVRQLECLESSRVCVACVLLLHFTPSGIAFCLFLLTNEFVLADKAIGGRLGGLERITLARGRAFIYFPLSTP